MVIAAGKRREAHCTGLSLPAVRRLPVLTALALVAALAATGCGGSDKKTATKAGRAKPSTTAPAATTTAAAKAECQKVRAPEAKPEGKLSRPTTTLDPRKSYTATVETSCGTFAIALDVKHAPKTTASFASLAGQGFYDDTTFHRVIEGFVIQGGDPQGNGQGGPGYKVVEAPPRNTKYTNGVVAMAKTEIEDPGTSGSQFFVVAGPDAQLPPDYAVVGKVVSGMNVVDTIDAVPTGTGDQPIDPVVIKKIAVKAS
jgi:peptidyl-prolyl cis-trans isomerase B (cyclophilin B)